MRAKTKKRKKKNFWRYYKININNSKITLEEVKKDQYKMSKQLKDLEEYVPRNLDWMNSRKKALINAEELYHNRSSVIKAFEDGVSPFKDEVKKKEPNSLKLPDYVEMSYDRFYEIKHDIDNNNNKIWSLE